MVILLNGVSLICLVCVDCVVCLSYLGYVGGSGGDLSLKSCYQYDCLRDHNACYNPSNPSTSLCPDVVEDPSRLCAGLVVPN